MFVLYNITLEKRMTSKQTYLCGLFVISGFCCVFYIIFVEIKSTPSQRQIQTKTLSSISTSAIQPNISRVPEPVKAMFHVVITFPILKDTKNMTNHQILQQRMMEYADCLTRFLQHDLVQKVHLLYNSFYMKPFIHKMIGSHVKLDLHEVDLPDVVLTRHQFAFTHLQGEVVIITQADTYLGEGFNKINKTLLIEHRLMYSLSRHEAFRKMERNMCDRYIGSHDAFIFVPIGEISDKAKKLLSHHVTSWGTENVIMCVYSKYLNYKVLNPCRSIKIYHFHRSTLRIDRPNRIRINGKDCDAKERPTENLV